MYEVEPDVVRRGLPEVAHHEFDDMPVRRVRFHVNHHVRPQFIALSMQAIPLECARSEQQRTQPERQPGPRRDRQPSCRPQAAQIGPPILNHSTATSPDHPIAPRTLALR